MINNRLLHYQSLQGFLRDLDQYGVEAMNDKIAFIKDKGLIWTHQTYYGGGGSGADIDIDTQLSSTSTNPVQNKVVKAAIDSKADESLLQNYATKQELFLQGQTLDTKLNKSKGYFSSFNALQQSVSSPEVGDWAIISDNDQWVICTCLSDGTWSKTEEQYSQSIDLSEYVKGTYLEQFYATKQDLTRLATKSDLDNKQDLLVSGRNIKTINNKSIVGSGNINITFPSVLTGVKCVIIEQPTYDLLQEYEQDTIYFIVEPTSDWTFGGTFPIRFSETWKLGGEFPIKLS